MQGETIFFFLTIGVTYSLELVLASIDDPGLVSFSWFWSIMSVTVLFKLTVEIWEHDDSNKFQQEKNTSCQTLRQVLNNQQVMQMI